MSTKKSAEVEELDLKKLRAEIEAGEREAYAEFEAKMKERREKTLAGVLEPLKKKRNEAAQQRNDLDTLIRDIDRQIADLSGTKLKAGPSGGKRKRRSGEEILGLGQIIFEKLSKSKKNEHRPSDLQQYLPVGIKTRDVVKYWNSKKGREEQIHTKGEKAKTVYLVP